MSRASLLTPPEAVTPESLRKRIAEAESRGDERTAELGRHALRRLLKIAPARPVLGIVREIVPLAPARLPVVTHERMQSAFAFQAKSGGWQ